MWRSRLSLGKGAMDFRPGRERIFRPPRVLCTDISWSSSQAFRLSPVQSESHLLVDAGLLLLIIGLRRGAFRDHTDLDSLIAGNEIALRWHPEWLKRPVFCAGGARGLSIDDRKPMRYHAFCDFLKTTCIQAGLGGMSAAHDEWCSPQKWSDVICLDRHMSAYCFRRGTSTTMTRVLGSELSKAILQHKQNSETLQRSYAYNATQQDLTAAVLYDRPGQAIGRSKYDAPALHRCALALLKPSRTY